jgi:GH15 family glucan-1,4-alpha-glucosidase
MFGYFDIKDPKVTAAYETLRSTLMTNSAKVIRYENDAYRRFDGKPSNPWPVTSLWIAQYALEKNDKIQAGAILKWVQSVAYPSGVIAEQYDVGDNPLSVAPLTWSQAEYMNVLLDMITVPGDSE